MPILKSKLSIYTKILDEFPASLEGEVVDIVLMSHVFVIGCAMCVPEFGDVVQCLKFGDRITVFDLTHSVYAPCDRLKRL